MEKELCACGTDRSPMGEPTSTIRAENGDGGCGCGCDGGMPPSVDQAPCVGYAGCAEGSFGLGGGYPPAMVYAPCQLFCGLYDPETALSRGTLFSELDLPLGGTVGGSFCAVDTPRRGGGCPGMPPCDK